jgi:hypothetical protein
MRLQTVTEDDRPSRVHQQAACRDRGAGQRVSEPAPASDLFLIKAAIAGLVMASHGEESCSPPFVYTPGRIRFGGQTCVGYLTVVGVNDFKRQVLHYAEEYRQSQAVRRDYQKGAGDAVGRDPEGEGTR